MIILNFRIRFYQKFQLAIFAFMVAVQCFESGKIFINYLNFCHVCLDFSLTSVFEHLRTFKVMKVMIACDWELGLTNSIEPSWQGVAKYRAKYRDKHKYKYKYKGRERQIYWPTALNSRDRAFPRLKLVNSGQYRALSDFCLLGLSIAFVYDLLQT